jgi:hypothetical protein
MKRGNDQAKSTGYTRGRYKTKQRLANLRADLVFQPPCENEHVEMRGSASTNAEQSTPLANDEATLDYQVRTVTGSKGGRLKELDHGLDATELSIWRGGKHQAAAIHHGPAKRLLQAFQDYASSDEHTSHQPGFPVNVS